MALSFYNTLTRQQEPFVPLDPANVRMYVCGPTVYDRAHIGNARPVVVFDVLYRLLKSLYPRVTYVRNITDVDDKIMAAAKERGIAIDQLTTETTAMYHADMAALNALPPDVEPCATQHIPQMIAMIERLISSGNAYAVDGHVLFNVPSMANYGKLSRRSLKEMIAGARVEVAPYKKDPADFVLWKPSTPDQPGWDSPWGRGRPGWHIECSAMSEAHLGETFDIHGGGLDLIFPHHENEIAQSTCAHHGKPFVKVWLHNGFLSVNGEKMSKSLGNFFTVADLLAKVPGEAIRMFLLKAHYRSPLDFTEDGLKEVKATLDRWYRALQIVKEQLHFSKEQWAEKMLSEHSRKNTSLPPDILGALGDDLNTPLAIARLNMEVDGIFSAKELADTLELRKRAEWVCVAGYLLGLLQEDPDEWLKGINFAEAHMKGIGIMGANAEVASSADNERLIDDLISQRDRAKKARNFAEADRIRDELKAKNIILEDTPGGTKWRRS